MSSILVPVASRPIRCLKQRVACVFRGHHATARPLRRPKYVPSAVEGDADLFVMVPWNAEESWSEESEQMMKSLIEKFQAADKDGNGVIDRDELRGLLERVGDGSEAVPMNWLTEEEVDQVYKQYDKNKDGVISFDEFVTMAQDKLWLQGQLAEYQEAFRLVDQGKNGTVGATELYHLFQNVGNPISYEKLVKVFEKYDVNNSGAIDFPEFLRMFKDELLDLQDILAYIKLSAAEVAEAKAAKAEAKAAPATPPPTEAVELKPGGATMVFSEEQFEEVLRAHPHKVVVLMASLTWCKPCKAFSKNYEATAKHYADSTVFLKLFGNSNDSTKALFKERLKCRSTPTFYFFRDNKLLGQCQGANGPRLEYNLRMMLKQGEGPSGLLFPPYTPPADA